MSTYTAICQRYQALPQLHDLACILTFKQEDSDSYETAFGIASLTPSTWTDKRTQRTISAYKITISSIADNIVLDQPFRLHIFNSLLPQRRMYIGCGTPLPKQFAFLNAASHNIPTTVDTTEVSGLRTKVIPAFDNLDISTTAGDAEVTTADSADANDSKVAAAVSDQLSRAAALTLQLNAEQRAFVEAASTFHERVALHGLQGPPGTGKTTTLVALIAKHATQEQSQLISAPTNKALFELIRRLRQAMPDIPMVWVGDDNKLPADLACYSLTHYSNCLRRVGELLQDLLFLKEEEKAQYDISQLQQPLQQLQTVFENCYTSKMLTKVIHDGRTNNFAEIYHYLKEINKALIKAIDQKTGLDQNMQDILFSIKVLLTRYIDPSEISNKLIFLHDCPLIFATAVVCGRREILWLQPRKVIVDEAGTLLPAETPLLLARANSIVLVGDPKQLPALVTSQRCRDANYDHSTLEQVMSASFETVPQVSMHHLVAQYRMHPAICAFPNREFYADVLKNACSIQSPAFENTHLQPLTLIDTSADTGNHEQHLQSSYYNPHEAALIVRLVKVLLNEGVSPENIGIISFYKGQVHLIRQQLKWQQRIDVNTVDGFQGGEKDYIIISCVRTQGTGFTSDPQRLNVALTRAKLGCYVIANSNNLANASHGENCLSRLVGHAQETGVMVASQEVLPSPTPSSAGGLAASIWRVAQQATKHIAPDATSTSKNKFTS